MFETLIQRIKHWSRVQAGIEVLRGFDDRRLADMGIERELIPQIARTGVIVTLPMLADEAERQTAVATLHTSRARPPSFARKREDCAQSQA